MIRDNLVEAVRACLVALGVEPGPHAVRLERPARPEHGDWSTNAALATAKVADRNPRELAAALADRLVAARLPHVAAVEVAGPGFVNFRLDDGWLHDVLRQVATEGVEGYARHRLGAGERVNLEFVSANPTGPLHVGNGWWCAYGDALARVLARCGWSVQREYYVNDTGGQIRQLGESLLARRQGAEVPEEGYQGAYVTALARTYDGPDDVTVAGRWAAERIVAEIRTTLETIGVFFDEWFSQASIEDSQAVAETIGILRERGVVYEQHGAVWLRSTDFGDNRDRVLVKSNGDFTYLAGDLAYHRNKFFVRCFDRVINVLGADHHGQVASLLAGVYALGVDPGRLEIRLGQMVSLAEGRMSKRSGNFVPLSDLVADIGADATRLLSLMSSIDQPTTIDLETVRRQSMDNPVYYVQYAHARIASIGRVAAERGVSRRPLAEVDLSVLGHQRELDVLRSLSELPDVVLDACITRAPHKVSVWVRELAGRFHGFYHDCPVLGAGSVPERSGGSVPERSGGSVPERSGGSVPERGGGSVPERSDAVVPSLTQARLWLVEVARVGLAVGLDLLGVGAPDSM